MDAVLKIISKEEFNSLQTPVLFRSGGLDRKYALISNKGISNYIVGWQSEITSPKFINIDSCIHAIGIDLNFCIVNLCNQEILIRLDLSSYFFDVILITDKILVITEIEIYEIRRDGYEIIAIHSLPDIFEKLDIEANVMHVKCMDGRTVDLELSNKI